MKISKRLGGLLLVLLTGCVDTVDTISREYRSALNEGIDALMMVRTEAQADNVNTRVFKPLGQRFRDLEDKLKPKQGKDFTREAMGSEGLQMYITEMDINAQRFGLEMTRLRKLMQIYVDRNREALRASGDDNPVVSESRVCPALHALITSDVIRKELRSPKLLEFLRQAPGQKVEGYDKMYADFVAKRSIYKVPREIRLVR
jgi:hypothetical protein